MAGFLQSSQRSSGEGLCPSGPRGDSLTPHRLPELGLTSATRRLCLQERWGDGASPGAAPGFSGSPAGPGGSHVARPTRPASLFRSSWPSANGFSISGLEKLGQRRFRGRWGKVKNSFARCPRRGTIRGAEARALQILPLSGRRALPLSPARRRWARTAAPSAEEARLLRQAPGGSGALLPRPLGYCPCEANPLLSLGFFIGVFSVSPGYSLPGWVAVIRWLEILLRLNGTQSPLCAPSAPFENGCSMAEAADGGGRTGRQWRLLGLQFGHPRTSRPLALN